MPFNHISKQIYVCIHFGNISKPLHYGNFTNEALWANRQYFNSQQMHSVYFGTVLKPRQYFKLDVLSKLLTWFALGRFVESSSIWIWVSGLQKAFKWPQRISTISLKWPIWWIFPTRHYGHLVNISKHNRRSLIYILAILQNRDIIGILEIFQNKCYW